MQSSYCPSPYRYTRRVTREVMVGVVGVVVWVWLGLLLVVGCVVVGWLLVGGVWVVVVVLVDAAAAS